MCFYSHTSKYIHTATCNVMGATVCQCLGYMHEHYKVYQPIQIHLQFYIPYTSVLAIQGLTNKYLDQCCETNNIKLALNLDLSPLMQAPSA